MNAPRQFSVAQMYEDHRDKLKLSWVIAIGVDRKIELKKYSKKLKKTITFKESKK